MPACPYCSSSDLTRDGHDQRGRVVRACRACGRHATVDSASLISGHRFPRDVILLAVRCYLQLGAAAERMAGILADRGVDVSGRTNSALGPEVRPALSEEICRHRKPLSTTWLVDETYVKIQGGRHYLYRGIDEHGQVLDCWLCRSPASLDGEPPHPEQLFYAGGMDAEHEVKPRPPIINPRCPDCKTGNMMHPAHVWEPCPVKMPNRELCGCTSRNKT